MTQVLFASSEAHPLMKTGGLGDVANSLPRALLKLKVGIRLLLPAYHDTLVQAQETGVKPLCEIRVDGEQVRLLQTRLPGTRITVWLVEHSSFSSRPGNPYCSVAGEDWPDNHWRFLLFCKVARLIALNKVGLGWQPDIVHGSDWQTGMIFPLLQNDAPRPATVFTIHNLAYRGLFPHHQFLELGLPHSFWHPDALEFYGQLSFIKGGLVYADNVNAVSPSYAEEVKTPEFGCGLDGVLRARGNDFVGILNGINTEEWNPGKDPHLAETYNRRTISKKRQNKLDLQQRLGLTPSAERPLLGFIGRLVEQKGVDLLLQIMPQILGRLNCQVAILGSGMPHYQQQLQLMAEAHPGQLSLTLGYSEALAHRIEAGVDIFLMPSMFEPCGLNQMYSLRYGTPVVAHAVGGLKDTIHCYSQHGDKATGFLFDQATGDALLKSIEQALQCFGNEKLWRQLQLNGMSQDFSWDQSAQRYLQIYRELSG